MKVTLTLLVMISALLSALGCASHRRPAANVSWQRCEGTLGESFGEQRVLDCSLVIERFGAVPEVAFAFSNRAKARLSLGNIEGALRDYDLATDLDASLPGPFLGRGIIFARNGELRRAVAQFDEAVRLAPERAEAYANRASANLLLQNFREAIGDLDEAIRLEPSEALFYRNRGSAYMLLRELPTALVDLDRAVEMTPGDSVAWILRGMAYTGRRQVAEALTSYDAALSLAPDSVWALAERCWLRAAWVTGQLELAEADCERASSLDPNSAPVQRSNGLLLLRQHRFTQALQAFSQSLETEPNSAFGLLGRGVARMRLGDLAAGELDIANALQRDASLQALFIELNAGD